MPPKATNYETPEAQLPLLPQPSDTSPSMVVPVGQNPSKLEASTPPAPPSQAFHLSCFLLKTLLVLLTCGHAYWLAIDSSLPITVATAGWICCLAAIFATSLSRERSEYTFASLLSSLCANLYVLRIGLVVLAWTLQEESLGKMWNQGQLRSIFLLMSVLPSLLITTGCTFINMQNYLMSDACGIKTNTFQQRLQAAMVVLYLAGFVLQEVVAVQSFRILIAEDFLFSAPGFALDFVLEVAWIYTTCLTICECRSREVERFHTMVVFEVMFIKAFNLWFSSIAIFKLIGEARIAVVASYLRALWVAIVIKFVAFQVLGINKILTLYRKSRVSPIDNALQEGLIA